jgi:hypothetical protein
LVLVGYIFFGKNSFGRANRNAGAAINAGIGVNPEKRAPLWVAFRAGDDAIYRTNFDTIALAGAE